MSEYIVVVDPETGIPQGREERAQVHANGLSHEHANVVLFRPSGKIIITERHYRGAYPGYWEVTYGEHVKADSSADITNIVHFKQAVKRNVIAGGEEELGLHVSIIERGLPLDFRTITPGETHIKYVGRASYIDSPKQPYHRVWGTLFAGICNEPLTYQDGEVASSEEIELEDLLTLLDSPEAKLFIPSTYILTHYLNELQKLRDTLKVSEKVLR